jgi:hypothetical protein
MEMTRRDVLRLGGAAAAAGSLGAAGLLLSPQTAGAQAPKRGGIFRIRGEDPIGFDPQLVLTYRTMTTSPSPTAGS